MKYTEIYVLKEWYAICKVRIAFLIGLKHRLT